MQALFGLLEHLEPILLILLGWTMGLLAPPISQRILRRYRRRDLMNAVVDELASLQFTMALSAYLIRARRYDVSNIFLDQILPIIENYHGPDRNEMMIKAVKEARELSEQQRTAAYQALKKPNTALSLLQYGLPLFVTQTTDLAICPLSFQRAVLNVHHHLDIWNQSVPRLQSLFDKTFEDLSDENCAAVKGNLEAGYKAMAERAEIILNAIGAIRR